MSKTEPRASAGLPQLSESLASLAMVVGFGLVGVSAFGLLAAGPRVVGAEGYTGLALAWTVVTIIGIGVASPGEQVIARGIAGNARTGVYRAVRRRLLLASPAFLLVIPVLGKDSGATGNVVLWMFTLALSTIGWFWLALVRGLLAGRHHFAAYAATLAAEAITRLLLVASALVLEDQGAWLLAAAVALPLLLSAALGRHWTKGDAATTEAVLAEESRGEQFSMTTVALLIQVCVSTAQLWLHRQSPDAALSGAFVTAASYMRIPTLLAGGLYAPLLTAAALAYAENQRRRVLGKTLEAIMLGAGGSTLLVVALLALIDVGMAILYGGPTGLTLATFVWLGAGTVLFVVASILTNSLYGCQRAPSAMLGWLPAALLATLLFALADGRTTWLAAATALALGVACLLLAGLFVRALPPKEPV